MIWKILSFFDIISSVMEMESLNTEKRNELRSTGMEFAFEGISPEQFKFNTPEEQKAFLEGYKEGIQIIKKNTNEEENNKKMAA